MNNLKVSVSGEIYKTKNYDLFNTVYCNRDVKEPHVRNIMESMREKQLLAPITVNRHYEVIDGQHRLEAAKRLRLPVYFIKANNYGINEMMQLNQTNKTWKEMDYIRSFSEQGIDDYIKLENFLEDYKGIYDTICARFILGESTSSGDVANAIKDGTFRIKNYKADIWKADYIYPFMEFMLNHRNLTRAHARTYFYAIYDIVEIEDFDMERLLHKLQLKSLQNKIVPPVNRLNAKEILQDIYNNGYTKESGLRLALFDPLEK